LVLPWPHPDWEYRGHRPEPTNPQLAGDPDFTWDLKAVIDLEQETQRCEVLPGEAFRIDLRHVAKTPKALFDLLLVPVLIGEIHDSDKG
jgi:hypothetical protein